MLGNRGLVVMVVAFVLMAGGGMVVPSMFALPSATQQAAELVSPTPDAAVDGSCEGAILGAVVANATTAPPGCCSTQCNTDKDCNKICGRGNCACLQQTSCCRRCVY